MSHILITHLKNRPRITNHLAVYKNQANKVKKRISVTCRTIYAHQLVSSNFKMFSSRVVLLVLFIQLLTKSEPYMIPPVQFIVAPHGFEASIPGQLHKKTTNTNGFNLIFFVDSPNVTFFAFHGRLNEEIGDGEPGEFAGEIRRPEAGRWVYKTEGIDLKVGDTIFYWIFVESERLGYSLNNKQYTITGNSYQRGVLAFAMVFVLKASTTRIFIPVEIHEAR